MKKFIYALLAMIATAAFLWFWFSVASKSFDVMTWSEDAAAVFSIVGGIVTGAVGAIVFGVCTVIEQDK